MGHSTFLEVEDEYFSHRERKAKYNAKKSQCESISLWRHLRHLLRGL